MKAVKSVLTVIASGMTAALALNLLLLFYHRLPVHIKNPDKSTDYTWEAGGSWSKMTEGISWGKMDAAGFNNRAVIPSPDVLILGSSHMEATNVFQKHNTANRLQDFLRESGFPLSVYNKGISGHYFLKCCKYLGKNSKDTTADYIAIETSKIDWTETEIQKLFDDAIEYTQSHASGLIFYLQKMPLFRILWTQCEHGLLNLFGIKKNGAENSPTNEDAPTEAANRIEENYDRLFSYIAENANGRQVVVFYHPTGLPKSDGSLEYSTPEDYLTQFSKSAEKYGVGFIDLTGDTEKLWKLEHKTTHGFTTGTAFSGHINKNGHSIAARRLADYIIQNEKEGRNVAF